MSRREAASLFDADDHTLGLINRAVWIVTISGLQRIKPAAAIRPDQAPEVAA